MIQTRSSGILAHITSLPSPYGIGDLGPSSYAFVDFLVACGQSYWQFLPTGPTNDIFDNSPYMSASAFAGSPMLISPELLLQEGLISQADIDNRPSFSPFFTDYGLVRKYKEKLLQKACHRFRPEASAEYSTFLATSAWLDDYAIFMTIKDLYANSGWIDWPSELATRKQQSLQSVLADQREKINYFRFEQYEFFRQWRLLRRYATSKHISLVGDLPIYVSYDSVDVWTNQEIFSLDGNTLRPTKVSGVPPDYFSKTGQRWGNPLYDWHNPEEKVQNKLINWWTERFSKIFSMVDITRIDHFRGFESFWAIPEANDTAIEGEWIKGPGANFFKEIYQRLGPMNIIAEDLGIITKEVAALRDELGFPGMKVLQFAFDGNESNSFLPHNFLSPNCIVYTGTHDNDTTVGWFLSDKLDDNLRQYIKKIANRSLHDQNAIHNDLIYLAQSSIAQLCIFPLQDILGFGNDCKMNSPGIAEGNWRWRCAKEFLTPLAAEQLNATTGLFGRGRKKPRNSQNE
jgi:4-alpha-glucanotransferase